MQFATQNYHRSSHRHQACSDQVIGAILSGWRYDISGIPRDLRGDYDSHLRTCGYCKRRQIWHRTIDLLLLAATTLSFGAFLLTAFVLRRYDAVLRRYEAARNIGDLHLHLPASSAVPLVHIPSSITISLEALAIAGVVVSMLLWVLVAIATPVPGMLAHLVREHFSPELSERKQAA